MDWYSGYAAVFPIYVARQHAMHAECDIVYQLCLLVGLSNAGIVSKPMDITLLTAW